MASSFKKRTVIARSLKYSLKKLDYQSRYSLNKALWEIQLQQQYQCDGLSERAAKMLLEYAEWLIIVRGYESMEYSEELALAFMTYQLEQYVDLMRGTNGKGPKLTKTLSEVAWKAEKEFFNAFGGVDLGTKWDVKVMDLQGVIAVSPADWNAPAVEDWKSLIRSLLSVEPSVEPQLRSDSRELIQNDEESYEVEEETDEALARESETPFEAAEERGHEENLEEEGKSASLQRHQDNQKSFPVDSVGKEALSAEDQVGDGMSPEKVPKTQGDNYFDTHARIDDASQFHHENREKSEMSRAELMNFLDEVYCSNKEETASEKEIIKNLGSSEDIDSESNNRQANYPKDNDENEKDENTDHDMEIEEMEDVHEVGDQDMVNNRDRSLNVDHENGHFSGMDTTISEHSPRYTTPDESALIDITIPIPSSIQVSQTEVQSTQPEHQICSQSETVESSAVEASQVSFQEISTGNIRSVNEDEEAEPSEVFARSSREPSPSIRTSIHAPTDIQDSSVLNLFNTLPPSGTRPQDDAEGKDEDTLPPSNPKGEVQVSQMLMIKSPSATNDQPTITDSVLDILPMIPDSSLRDQLSKLSTLSELVDEANTVIREIKSSMPSRSQNEETFITESQVKSLLNSVAKSEQSNVKSVLDILDLRLGRIVQDIRSFKNYIPAIKFIEVESMRTSQMVKEDHDMFGSSIRSLQANLDALLQMHGDAMRFTEAHINGLGGKTQQLGCALSAMEARLNTDQSNKIMEVQNEINRLTNHFAQLGKNTLTYVQETKAAFQKFQPRLDSALKLSTDVKRDLETYVAHDKSKVLDERLRAVETNLDEISFSNMKELRKLQELNAKLEEENTKLKEENLNVNRKISLLERKMDDQQKIHEAKFGDLITEVSDTIRKMNNSSTKNVNMSPRGARSQKALSQPSAGESSIAGSQYSSGSRNNHTLSLPLGVSIQQSESSRASSHGSPTRSLMTAPSKIQRVPSSSRVADAPMFKPAEKAIVSTIQTPHKKKDFRKGIPNPQSTITLVDSLMNNAPPRGVKRRTPPSRPLNFNENIDLKKIKLLKPNSS